jgi:hypothetical protein
MEEDKDNPIKDVMNYFESTPPEQFRKDWEQVVGNHPKLKGPNISDLLENWEELDSSSEQDPSITAMYVALMDKLHGKLRGSNFTPPKKKRKKKNK